MLIKICGIKRELDIIHINELKPDFIGFVFAFNSSRTINIEKALELKSLLNDDIEVVGVFKNNDLSLIKEAVVLNIIDYIQLQGNEDDDYILEIKKFCNLPIIKAYNDSIYADYILYDNVNPGSGKTFDWTTISTNKPFFLAGGICIGNINDAKKLNPYCIDVSSSVETNGVKDYNKMKELIERCRND